jgi:hypothetical protein
MRCPAENVDTEKVICCSRTRVFAGKAAEGKGRAWNQVCVPHACPDNSLGAGTCSSGPWLRPHSHQCWCQWPPVPRWLHVQHTKKESAPTCQQVVVPRRVPHPTS